MAKIYSDIGERIADFIREQRVFFVGTAPLAGDGHVNISPKGLDSFRVLGPNRVAYLDLVGSGIETVSHLRENGRLVLMFCAFEGSPKIVRLYGRGSVVEPGDAEWQELLAHFPPYPNARSVIVADIERVSDSCGFGVPLYRYQGDRSQLRDWAQRKGADGLLAYKGEHNRASIDGLPGLLRPRLGAV
jgi:hypothetical protein